MKVLIIITKSDRGGAQVHVLDLIRMLQGDAEPILACGNEGFLTREARKLGIEVHILPELVHPIRPFQDLCAVLATIALIRRIDPDIVHAHTAKAGLIGRLAASLTRTPVFYTVHSWSFVGSNSCLLKGVAIWIERAMRLCGGTVIEVCHSNFELARRKGVANAESHVAVWNGMPDTNHRAEYREVRAVCLLMAARFVHQKDHATLLHALAGIKGEWQLTFAGDGPTRLQVEQLSRNLGLHDRVHFIGEVDKIESLMADSDVFVLSTRYDSLPLSIIEAMRAGLPVIATGVGGIPELITHGFNGYVSRVADPCSLREALAPVIQSSQERRRMGQNGRARYERSFRLSTMFRRVLSLYRDAADTQSQEITMLLTPETTR